MEELKLENYELSPTITFESNCSWVMKITRINNKRVILFNTEENPDMMPNDFAKEVCKILHESNLLEDLIKREVGKGKE